MIEGIADVLGDTDYGLTGKQIGETLAALEIADPGETTKKDRLRIALRNRQVADGHGGRIVTFIVRAMEPVRYRNSPAVMEWRRQALDEVLVFAGLHMTEKGKVAYGARAETLDEAALHANSLRAELRRRSTHTEVLRYCTREVLMKNYFHATLEASKSAFDRLRSISGHQGDGAALVDATLSLGKTREPVLRINSLATQTERDEQNGFANMLKGIYSMYRNPVSHDPRLSRQVSDDEFLELATMLSAIHRRLDTAQKSASSS